MAVWIPLRLQNYRLCFNTSMETTATTTRIGSCVQRSAPPTGRCIILRSRRACSRQSREAWRNSDVRTMCVLLWKSLLGVISHLRRRSIARTRVLSGSRDLPHRSLPGQRTRPEPPLFPLRQYVSGTHLEPQLRRQRADYTSYTWGPAEAGRIVAGHGVWQNPAE